MFTALIGPIANLASSWMDSKVEKVKADGQAKVAQAKAKDTATPTKSQYIRSNGENNAL